MSATTRELLLFLLAQASGVALCAVQWHYHRHDPEALRVWVRKYVGWSLTAMAGVWLGDLTVRWWQGRL
jgi:hypothetical protein